MKVIRINKLGFYNSLPGLAEISASLDKLIDKWSIDTINWGDFSYSPDVKFKIAYSNSELFIKYYVTEDYVKAEKAIDNDQVCEDSCVEFFVEPAKGEKYLNFEFNSIGTCYLGSGKGREDSRPLDKQIVSKVRRHSSLAPSTFKERKGKQSWELTVAIPFDLIFDTLPEPISGKTIRVNFYKCGDKLSVPHFLTWNNVETDEPDFHRPEYFGELVFD